ncbi:transmembrane channel 7 isoform X1 [Brachionus plicatilis]|uniref:Transmembrane channel 7 isoform X1 n=1 Tax=Brachionus plicatilis TaxID=10195 RepID=A0A3M7T775_BRAPC|nr:transmembrane channel 7 isoform X1 [Brachionus plicatilis]
MGLSFASITLMSLVISAIGMLLRLGKGLETSIINRIETISMINQSFVLWDYNLKGEKTVELTKSIIYRFYENEINQIKYNQKMNSLDLKQKFFINFNRAVFHVLTILMFGIAGFGLYYLNEFTFELKGKDLNRYVLSIVEYLPAIAINIIILVYPIFDNFKTNLFLLRTGFTRIASILFIICWETYVGQEFYKLVVIDLIVKILLFMFITRADFDLESNFFDLMNAQTLFWIGLYFSPFLAVFAPFYFLIKFYLTLITLKYFTDIQNKNSQMKLNTSFFMVLFVIKTISKLWTISNSVFANE